MISIEVTSGEGSSKKKGSKLFPTRLAACEEGERLRLGNPLVQELRVFDGGEVIESWAKDWNGDWCCSVMG